MDPPGTGRDKNLKKFFRDGTGSKIGPGRDTGTEEISGTGRRNPRSGQCHCKICFARLFPLHSHLEQQDLVHNPVQEHQHLSPLRVQAGPLVVVDVARQGEDRLTRHARRRGGQILLRELGQDGEDLLVLLNMLAYSIAFLMVKFFLMSANFLK